MADKKNPLGPIGENVRANIQRIRTRHGISYRELSDRLNAVGRPIPTLGLSRLESGDRRVDVDDLLALAYVLDVAPSRLLLPVKESAVRVVPISRLSDDPHSGLISAADAKRWIAGEQPLRETDVRIYLSEVDEETFRARFGHGSGSSAGSDDASR